MPIARFVGCSSCVCAPTAGLHFPACILQYYWGPHGLVCAAFSFQKSRHQTERVLAAPRSVLVRANLQYVGDLLLH